MLQHTLPLFHFLVLTVKHQCSSFFFWNFNNLCPLAEVHVYIFIKLFWAKRESGK